MGISNKTRKLLWGRSGNRCAICKQELTPDISEKSSAIIGEECHIHSGKVGGPRYDETIPIEKIDQYLNLILLCCNHHTIIDNQCEAYTAKILKEMKRNHEKWVSNRLSPIPQYEPIRIVPAKGNAPEYLSRITLGKELLNYVDGACGLSLDYDEPNDNRELTMLKEIMQSIQEIIDFGDIYEASDKMQLGFDLNKQIQELDGSGFWVFAARENRIIKGGVAPPDNFPVLTIRFLRKTNPAIQKMSSI